MLNLDRSTWRRVRLGHVVANINEYFDPDRDGVLPYVAGPHINPARATVESYGSSDDVKFPPSFKRLFAAGDVLIHSRGVAKVAAVDRRGVTGEKLFVLRTKDPAVLEQGYLTWLLRSGVAGGYFRANFSGSVNKFLNWRPLADFEFDLPPLGQQRRIADLLWAIERHRTSLLRLNDRLDATVRSLADHVFPVWLASRAAPLNEIFDFQLGKMLSSKTNPTPEEPGFPYLGNIDVRWRDFDLASLRRVRLTDSERVKFRLQPGDVLVCEGRGVGRSAVWREQDFDCYYQKALHRLRAVEGTPLHPEVLVEYLAWCANTHGFKQWVGDNLIPHLTEVKFKTVPAPLPTAADQQRYLSQSRDLRSLGDQLSCEIARLSQVGKSACGEVFSD